MSDLSQPKHQIHIMIVDDHPAIRQGLRVLLELEGFSVCAEAEDTATALTLLQEHQPDVVLVDLSLGDEDGIVLLCELNTRGFATIVYSMHEDGKSVEKAFAFGALGYVTKREVSGVLVTAIREVVARHRFISPRAAIALANRAAHGRENKLLESLTAQESIVFDLLGKGVSIKDISLKMKISVRTVESYCSRIMNKLELSGMGELRQYSIKSHQNPTS